MNSQARSLSQQEIIEFAQAFDPQPYHLDTAAGDASIFGGLCASGWQVAALATQLVTEALTAEGVRPVMLTGVPSLTWRKPTFVDQSISTAIRLGDRKSGSMVPGCDSQTAEISVFGPDESLVAEITAIFAVESGHE